MVEGATLIEEAFASALEVREVLVETTGDAPTGVDHVLELASRHGTPVARVEPGVLASLLDVVSPQPVVATVSLPRTAGSTGARTPPAGVGPALVLALDGVADPGNVGTLLRSAEAAGARGVLCGPGTADAFAPKVVRAAAGSLFRLVPEEVDDLRVALDAYRCAGWAVLGATGDGTPYDAAELPDRAVLVLGSEARGLSAEVAGVLSGCVTVPMAGRVESLNVAVAGSVLAFEFARRLRAERFGAAGADSPRWSGDA